MEFTLRAYLGNPYGKGNATFPNVSAIRSVYLTKLAQMSDTIVMKWYQYKEKSYICHIMLPSESVKGIYYDVVFEFEFPPNGYTSHTVLDLPCKVFSNAPSFSYTYAHAFLEEKILCNWLKNKYGKQIRRNAAGIRNSSSIIGFEKTIYISALFLSIKGRSDLTYIATNAEKITSTNVIEQKILSQENVETKYRDTKKQLKLQKEAEKKKEKEEKKPSQNNRSEKHIKSIDKISKSSHTESGKKAKTTNQTKRSKKI